MILRRQAFRSFRPVLAALVLAGTPALLVACGSDEPASSATTVAASSEGTGADAEEGYEMVSDAEVAAGFASTIEALSGFSAAPATITDEAITEVFEGWEGYEGTVKQNDSDTYLALEDALGAFKKAAGTGDQGAMATALGTFSTTASTYLAAHPG